jgi:hypothetical protein
VQQGQMELELGQGLFYLFSKNTKQALSLHVHNKCGHSLSVSLLVIDLTISCRSLLFSSLVLLLKWGSILLALH